MTEPATKPRLLELALTFNKISVPSFGGGLDWRVMDGGKED
jgi:hypothetical protein